MSIQPYNQWTTISWKQTIAPCDADFDVVIDKNNVVKFGSSDYVNYINRKDKDKNGKAVKNPVGLSFKDCLPEPFSGNINSKVYCLNMNPGVPDADFCEQSDKNGGYEYLNQVLEVLTYQSGHLFDNLMFDGQKIYKDETKFNDFFKPENLKNFKQERKKNIINTHRPHAGAIWQRELWNPMKTELRKNGIEKDPNLFIIEFFPYHSKGGFEFPEELPSYEYRNWLVEKALEEKKLIIIMRQERRWYDIKDKGLGDRLKSYSNKLLLRGSQKLWISPKNLCRDVNIYENPIPSWACKNMDEVIKCF